MKFTKIVYGIAAAYGFISLLPLYFLIGRVGHDAPPPITHPEFYYGFLGVTLLWQIVFVLIARDPLRYRPIMPLAILEKFVYSVPVFMLFLTGSSFQHCAVFIRRPDFRDSFHHCVLPRANKNQCDSCRQWATTHGGMIESRLSSA